MYERQPKYYDKPYNDGKTILSLQRSRWAEFWSNSASFTEMSYLLPLKEEVDSASSIDEENQTVIHYSTSIYYEGKKGERKLIWEKGQNIKDAPLSVEKKVAAKESGNPNEYYDPVSYTHLLQGDWRNLRTQGRMVARDLSQSKVKIPRTYQGGAVNEQNTLRRHPRSHGFV